MKNEKTGITAAALEEGKEITAADPEELVEFMAPMIYGKSDRDIFAAVNGENIRVQRGKRVKIKRKFAEVLEHAQAQEMAACDYISAVQEGSKTALASME